VLLSVLNTNLKAAFRAFGRKFIVGREGVGVHHGKADKEDADLPGTECDLHRTWMSRYMRRFSFAFGAVVTICLDRAHAGFLQSQTMRSPYWFYNGDRIVVKGISLFFESQSSLSFRIVFQIHQPRPTTMANMIMIPNHGPSIIIHLTQRSSNVLFSCGLAALFFFLAHL
jgi:hypothetical protein